MRHASLSILTGLLLFVGLSLQSVHAQPTTDAVQFNVAEPPSGSLGQTELDDIAATIRRLERHPMAEGADKARMTLVQWLQSSPDVTVSICPAIASPFAAGESPTLRRALQQHLLSTAAYSIEHPDADDPAAAKLSGLEGALRVYEAARGKGERGGAKSVEQLLQFQQEGKLTQYVTEGLKQCEGTN